MASDTFRNLPEEKRRRFLEAAWKEFTTCSYAEASINRIIQEAKISRGSFYQYFTGKHDLFLYLLKSLISTISQGFLAQLTVHGNDLFEAILGIFDLILWQSSSTREDLPQAARDYVEYVEKAIGCRITYVSVGPERDAIIIR